MLFSVDFKGFKHVHVLKAYAVAFFSVITVSISLPCVQILDGVVPEFELNALRFAAQVLLVAPVKIAKSCDVGIPLESCPAMVLIILLYTVFNLTYYTSALFLPVGTLDGLNNSVIILVNVLLSICVKAERKPYLYISAGISLCGILLLTQPGIIFNNPPVDSTNWTSPCADVLQVTENRTVERTNLFISSSSQWPGYLLIVISGSSAAAAFQVIHRFVSRIQPATVAFWVGVVGTTVSLVAMAIAETPTFPRGSLCVCLLLLHAFGVGQSSLAVPYCLKYLSPSVVTLINSLHLVFLFIFQFTFLSEIQPSHGNALEVIGAILCVIGGVLAPVWQLVMMTPYCTAADNESTGSRTPLLKP